MALANGTQTTYQAFSHGLKPDPKLSVSDWANENIYLPQVDSAEPGKYRVERTPYIREVLDELGPKSRTQKVTVQKGAQLGLTTIGNVWVSFIVGHAPGPILYVLPTLDTAKRTSRQRLQPMISACPALKGKVRDQKAKDASNSVMMKEFNGGILVFAGANSPAGLRSMPARYLYLDESSGYEPDIGNEGDPSSLAIARTATFKRHRKIFQPSTPTIKGLDRIEREFIKGDQRYYNVPCIHCGDKAPITWKRIKWDKETGDDGIVKHLPITAYILCENCGCKIEERHKTWMMDESNGAEWIPTAQGEPYHKSYSLNSLYSPLGWYSWGDAVSQFLEATEKAEQGDVSLLKVFTNTVLGETWISKGTEVSHNHIYKRREYYNAEAPKGVLYVCAGCDVQKDRIEILIFGFGGRKGQESWCLDHRILWGDPSDTSHKIYDELDEVLFESKYKHELGHELPIHATGIDVGYLQTQLSEYIKPRQSRGVFALKGDKGSESAPIVKAARNTKTGRDRRPVKLFMVGTFPTKSLVYGRLMTKKHGPGYIHFPKAEWADPEFFEQLTAERIEEKRIKGHVKRYFKKMRARNEILDCTAYSLATLHIANPNFDLIEDYYKEDLEEFEVVEDTNQIQQPKPVEQPRTQKPQRNKPFRRKRGTGFVHGW